MKKLDDIPKKNIFKVPDGYFENLPTVIQARMEKPAQRSWFNGFGFAVWYALPLAALIVVAIIWFTPDASIENDLDTIDPNQIALYLDNSYTTDVYNDEHESGWTTDELDSLEQDVYSDMEYSLDDDILDDIDL